MEEYFVEERTGADKFIDFLVFFAVFAVTIFLILEILAQTNKTSLDIVTVNGIYYYVNMVVFAIFVVDLIRLWIESSGPKDFFKNNWLDILATIPFGLIASALAGISQSSPAFEILKFLRVAKVAQVQKLQKISRISKVSKEFKAAAHLKRESDEYKRKHRI